jgi:cytochrome c5
MSTLGSSRRTPVLLSRPERPGTTAAQRNGVISKFCTGCHPYYVGTYDDGVGTNGNHPGSFNVGTFGGHIMTSTVNAYGNVKKSAGTPAQVAFASDLYCRDCHDSGNTQEGAGVHANNFPHYTTGMRFEKAALSTVGGAGARVDATQSPVQDGVCLKCHSDGVNGVNKNF